MWSSSSCHQTHCFHSPTHCFPTSLNVRRSSKEQGCACWEHCIICTWFLLLFHKHMWCPLLLFAFRDLWKEWGDSNFQIFSQNCQFHHRRLESLEHFNAFINHSEHYGLIFRGYHIIFTGLFILCTFPFFSQVHFACVLCI